MESMPTILVVGGGFSGVRCARDLAQKLAGKANVTLLSNRPHFEYYAALYRAAAGGAVHEVCIPLQEATGSNVKIIRDTITAIDPEQRTITGEGGKIYSYDYVVLGLGSEASYFGIQGIEQNTFTLKSMDDALRLKKHLHLLLEAKKHAPSDEKNIAGNIVVIGGGATGVELAGELACYARRIAEHHGWHRNEIHIHLVEAMSRLLPTTDETMSQRILERLRQLGVNVLLNHAIEKLEDDKLFFKGMELRAKTIVWTAGVKAHKFYASIPGIAVDKRGRAEVDLQLQAKGMDRVFVIGDGAATQYSGMAQTAIRDAHFVAKVLAAQVQGKPIPTYVPVKPDIAVPVGPGWAAVSYKDIPFYGFVGWVLRRAADCKAFLMMVPPIVALRAFKSGFETSESCPVCLAVEEPSRFSVLARV